MMLPRPRHRTGCRFIGNLRLRTGGGGGLRRRMGLVRVYRSRRVRRSVLLHGRALWLHGPALRLCRVRSGLCFGRVRFFRGLILWCRLFVRLLRHRGSSQRQ